MVSIEALAARLESQVDALFTEAETDALDRVLKALSRDGRPILNRGIGLVPAKSIPIGDAVSIALEPVTMGGSTNAQDALSEQANTAEELYFEIGDTSSVSLEFIPVGIIQTLFAALNFAGSGGDYGVADIPARSDHLHAAVYSPLGHVHSAPWLSGSATLDFGSIAAASWSSVLTITVTGAAAGAAHAVGPPAGLEADLLIRSVVTGASTVSVWLYNTSAGAIDPASATWTAKVFP